MSNTSKQVMQAFLLLPERERVACLNAMYESVMDIEDDDIFDELERRRAEFESGRDPGMPMGEVFEKLLGPGS